MFRDAQVREVRGAVPVGECLPILLLHDQRTEADGFLFATPVGSRESAVEQFAVPRDARGDDLVEPSWRPNSGTQKSIFADISTR